MKHIFIVNPAAGRSSAYASIEAALSRHRDFDVEIYETKHPHDAIVYSRQYCKTHTEHLRFYACGGDGTINEVANGIYGFPHASMSCYPCGSGNDFVKYYGGSERFLDMEQLMLAGESAIDLMKVNGHIAINVINFGFDGSVAETMASVRRKRIIGGKNAYVTGIVKAFFTAMRTQCKVYADGELLNPDGKMLLSTIACGKYVGGAYCVAPKSDNTDGLLDVSVCNPVSRFTLIRMIGTYKAGRHLDDPRLASIFTFRRAKKVVIETPQKMSISLDGEIIQDTHFEIEVLPSAIRFAVPGEVEAVTPQEMVL